VSSLAVHWVDVFTETRFAGNPLAVLPDADGLDSGQMQAIAAELGLSETTFVFGGAEQLRIFTPRTEMPLAGHPVVGAAHVLAWLGRVPSDGVHVFTTNVGATPLELHAGVATMTQGPLDPGTELDREQVAALLRVAPDDIVGTPRACSTIQRPQGLVQLRDRDMLARLEPDLPAIARFTDVMGIAPWVEHESELAQRFFLPGDGIDEDPATGSLAGAVAALRVLDGRPPGSVIVRQAAEIGRPSEMYVTVDGSPGAPDPPRVGGRAVPVMQGAMHRA
jgi:trans-2,3-dihydro-3-hydroxyanthranilate isomerase